MTWKRKVEDIWTRDQEHEDEDEDEDEDDHYNFHMLESAVCSGQYDHLPDKETFDKLIDDLKKRHPEGGIP